MCRREETDLTLALVEFAYNNDVTRSTRKGLLEIVHRYSLRTATDHIPFPPNAQISQLASTFA